MHRYIASPNLRNHENFDSDVFTADVSRVMNERNLEEVVTPRTKRYQTLQDQHRFIDDPNVGEITGRYIDEYELEQGMPMRSKDDQYAFSRYEKQNQRLDFDMYDSSKTDFNVDYYDPTLNISSGFSDIKDSSRIIHKELSDDKIIYHINIFAIHLFNGLRKRVSRDVVIAPLNVYCALTTLMLGSGDQLQKILLTTVPDGNPLHISNCVDMLRTDGDLNILYLPNEYVKDPTYQSAVSRLCFIENVDMRNPTSYTKINQLISRYTGDNLPNVLTPDKLNQKLLSVNCFVYRTQWKNFPAKITTNIFRGKKSRFMTTKYTRQRWSRVYKNGDLVELDLEDGCSIGFFLGDIKDITLAIDQLQDTVFEYLSIPIFTKHKKYNLQKVFETLGLDIFQNHSFGKITSKRITLGNIVHEMKFIVAPSISGDVRTRTRGIKLTFNERFFCYVRYKNCFKILSEITNLD